MNEPNRASDDPDNEFVELMQRHQEAVQAGQMHEADAAIQELFEIAGRMVVENPRPEWAFEEEARNHEAAGNWQAAEVAYRKALTITDAACDAVWQFQAHRNLSRLYRLLGRLDVALVQSRLATQHARRTDISMLLTGTLQMEAFLALEYSRVGDALTAIQEALLNIENDHPQDVVSLGRCLVLRAECHRRTGNVEQANADLETAMKQFQPLEAMEFAGGVHSGIAEWWTINARLLTDLKECNDALHAWRRAVAGSRHVANLPHCKDPYSDNKLAILLWEYGNALSAAGCTQESAEAIAESAELRNKIGLPPLP